jgi:hypothetical protein
MQLLLAPMPQGTTSPDESRKYLADFIFWLKDFFLEVEGNMNEMTDSGPLFEREQIEFFPHAFREVAGNGHFHRAHEMIFSASTQTIEDHGLYGNQLNWKLFNINFSFRRYLQGRSAALFEKLLTCIDTLLDSILSAIPLGSAIKELKEALLGSVALATD